MRASTAALASMPADRRAAPGSPAPATRPCRSPTRRERALPAARCPARGRGSPQRDRGAEPDDPHDERATRARRAARAPWRRTPARPGASRVPPTIAKTPAAIAMGTSGTTARFTAGATSDSRPNETRTSAGSPPVRRARCRGSPRASRASDHRPREPSQPLSGEAQASRPAGGDDREPEPRVADHRRIEQERRIAAAHANAAAARPARPELAREEHDAGHHRRANAPTATRPRRRRRRRSSPTDQRAAATGAAASPQHARHEPARRSRCSSR